MVPPRHPAATAARVRCFWVMILPAGVVLLLLLLPQEELLLPRWRHSFFSLLWRAVHL